MDLKKDSMFEDGHLGDESTGLYVDALLSGELAALNADVRAHVQDCPECKDKILEIYSFLNDQGRSEAVVPMPGFLKEASYQSRTKVVPVYLRRMAAVFFFMAIFLGAFFWMWRDGSLFERNLPRPEGNGRVETPITTERTGVGAVHEVSSQPKETSLPKMSKPASDGVKPQFRVNRNLEYMIDSNYRSKSVEVLTPANGETLGGAIRFSWKALSKDPLVLKILNNRNETLYSFEVAAGLEQTVLDFDQRLRPGLYYWKLESGQDLVHVGKFFRGAATSPKE